MECCRVNILAFVSLLFLSPVVRGWGIDGHLTICRIAQSRLSEAAAAAAKKLLPDSANDDLGSLCSWADQIKFHYHWSSALHFIDTPDRLCTYQYHRDCKDEHGVKDRCFAGAINNYTTQLFSYGKIASQYNLTEALLFLSHFMGDIHQPLHVGFISDRGGNTIDVHWYTRKSVLHHVWDDNIIETAAERFYDSNVDELIDAIQKNITIEWADQIKKWETCSGNKTACPDIDEVSFVKAACDWAYNGVREGSVLEDDYFLSRLPIVNLRLAEGGVLLAATLNRIFHHKIPDSAPMLSENSGLADAIDEVSFVKAACDWAYNGVREGSVLEDDYFLSRLPIVNLRLAEGGVWLAATLNRLFHDKIPDSAPMLWENSGLADAM